MTFVEIVRLEVGSQLRRGSTWVYVGLLFLLTYYLSRDVFGELSLTQALFFNAPYVVDSMGVLASLGGMLIAAPLAGDAAARHVRLRMDPLLYTTRASKLEHLAGRFVAAFLLYALILLVVPVALYIAAIAPPLDADLLGPFRLTTYAVPYLLLLVPNAFITTALMFSVATLTRRPFTSYVAGVLVFALVIFSRAFVAGTLNEWEVAKLIEPIGAIARSEHALASTPAQKNTQMMSLQAAAVANRALWIAIACGVLALTHARFRLAHNGPRTRRLRRWFSRDGGPAVAGGRHHPVPSVARTFGAATHAYQLLAIARESARTILTRWAAPVFALTAAYGVASGSQIEHMGVPFVPTTELMLGFLADRLTAPEDAISLLVPLVVVLYSGELIWREREAGVSEIVDAAPVPEWVAFTGKFAGLSLVLVAVQGLLTGVGLIVQGLGGAEPGLYVRVMFGLQLADYLLFLLLALTIHTVASHKYVGHILVLLAFLTMAMPQLLGINHKLLIYASDPGWIYSDMRGFGTSIGPWLWVKAYWAAWALLLAVGSRLLWVRGYDLGFTTRIAVAGGRFTRRTAGTAAVAAALVLGCGGFVFYNTNVLNAYRAPSGQAAWRAEYERRYGRYRDVPQPQVTAARLDVDVHPRRGAATVGGSMTFTNTTGSPIDSLHLSTMPDGSVRGFEFDRMSRPVVIDDAFGYRIYALESALKPGESVQLRFDVRVDPRGFSNEGIDPVISGNGTAFPVARWLPAIGYQSQRGLTAPADRARHGLPARPIVPLLSDERARRDTRGTERLAFEAVVCSDSDQTAVAPGRLRRTWIRDGRRCFDYATDAPIRGDITVYSARYTVERGRWQDASGSGREVSIEILHDSRHPWNVQRLLRSAQASLDFYTRTFGPYPHGQLRFIEHPGAGVTLHAAPINISYEERFSLLDAENDPRGLDLPFAVAAHEVAHQWWGHALIPAQVEGAGLLAESLAWYSALGVVEQTLGRDHLRRLLNMMREVYLRPQTRATVPLLRANDWMLAYRKGPFAMYALREYVGAGPINGALRRLIDRYPPGTVPLPTSLDLYRELQAVTPAQLTSLLADLFERNIYWDLKAHNATVARAADGSWQVTLGVHARKVRVDEDGTVTDVPMDDLVEIGVFTGGTPDTLGDALYLQQHRLRAGTQRISLTLPAKPARAGIDPRNLLMDDQYRDNTVEIP